MTGQPTVEWQGPNTLDALIAEHERGYAAFANVARQVRDEGRLEETFIDSYGLPVHLWRDDPDGDPPQRSAPR
jgi:hypothetical protein